MEGLTGCLLRQVVFVFLAVAGLAAGGVQAQAQSCPDIPGCGPAPPSTDPFASYSLSSLRNANAGTPTTYTFEFEAFSNSTPLIFEFRDDNLAVNFTNASVVNVATGASVSIPNSKFQQTTLTGDAYLPKRWNYANVNGYTFASAPGVDSCTPGSCWQDDTYGGYDSLSPQQPLATTKGSVYRVSFLAWAAGASHWLAANTNANVLPGSHSFGGNGANVAVFLLDAQDIPEPSTWAMLTIGFVGLGYLGWRRASRAQA